MSLESFLRRIAILEFLRRMTQPQSTTDIAAHLMESGYLGSEVRENSRLRLVQRDLRFLLGREDESCVDEEDDSPLGLVLERRGSRSLYWSLDRQATRRLDFELMPQNLAIALSVLQKHLLNWLPMHTREDLQQVFDRAEERLFQSENKPMPQHYQRLRDAVEFYQRGQSLQPPQYDEQVLEGLFQAIIQGRQLELYYQGGKRYRLSPCGLAYLLPKIYLVARNEQGEYRHFLLNRIESCHLLPQSSRLASDFNLKAYLQQGGMELPLNELDAEVQTVVLCIKKTGSGGLLRDLREYPLSDQQQLEGQADGNWMLRFPSRLSVQLRNWVVSLGPSVRVESPKALRVAVKAHLQQTLEAYD